MKLRRSLKLNVFSLEHISIFIYVFLNLKSFPIQEVNWKWQTIPCCSQMYIQSGMFVFKLSKGASGKSGLSVFRPCVRRRTWRNASSPWRSAT